VTLLDSRVVASDTKDISYATRSDSLEGSCGSIDDCTGVYTDLQQRILCAFPIVGLGALLKETQNSRFQDSMAYDCTFESILKAWLDRLEGQPRSRSTLTNVATDISSFVEGYLSFVEGYNLEQGRVEIHPGGYFMNLIKLAKGHFPVPPPELLDRFKKHIDVVSSLEKYSILKRILSRALSAWGK
jgi:hypothetical protein